VPIKKKNLNYACLRKTNSSCKREKLPAQLQLASISSSVGFIKQTSLYPPTGGLLGTKLSNTLY
jgi:hypothetical protein